MMICSSVILTVIVAQPAAGFHNSSSTSSDPVQGFEKLDKYAHCGRKIDPYMVYRRNLALTSQVVLKAGQDAGLIQQETVAIFGWTLGDFEFINRIAWGADEVQFAVEPFGYPSCKLYKADVSPYIDVLGNGMHKLPPAHPGTLWRGSKRTPEQLGKVVTGGFSSTSRNFDAAFNFVKRSGGSLWAVESHTSGKNISMFSDRPAEGEVLFPAGSRLEVVECSPTTIDDATRQKVKEAEAELQRHSPTAKIDIICLMGGSSRLVDAGTVIV